MSKTGKEAFTFNGEQLEINVHSFWKWSSSDLLSNTLRGILAEFIVASSIGVLDKPREEWDAFDLLTNDNLKVEVKSSSYLQSWKQSRLSKISFGIQPTAAWEDNARSGNLKRQSDAYVFCVLSHQDKHSVDPLNLSQWDFYILRTQVLNDKIPAQKTITLSSLLKLNPAKVDYDGIAYELLQISRLN